MKKVMVVDDDPGVLSMIATQLGRMGIKVLRADHAEAALALYSVEHPLDGLITDIRMGKMDGFELGTAMRLVQPDLRILFVSGYIADASEILSEMKFPENDFFLHKPFQLSELSQTVEMLFLKAQSAR